MSEQPTLLRMGFGKYNFSYASGTLTVFKVTKNPFKRELAVGALKKAGGIHVFPATQFMETGGALHSANVVHEEGTLVNLQYSKTVRGRPVADGGLFIRLRREGPLLLVRALIPAARESMLPEAFEVFQGYGDILSYSDVKALGYDVPITYKRRFMDQDEVEECFSVDTLAEGKASSVELITSTDSAGKEITLVVNKPRRRMKIRRD